MAHIQADGKTFEAADGTRLVLALMDNDIDILHRCGGKAKCTTCQVTFNAGEPKAYHPREKEKLESKGAMGQYRLSCHILCAGTMDVNVLRHLEGSGLDDAGPRPEDTIPVDVA